MSARVLVIEDEPALARLVSFNLEHAGFACATAGTGLSGLELARSHRPGLILLDMLLPDIGGTEVLRRLKEDRETAEIPVMIVSALDSEMDRVVGFELGATDYVVKPFSPRELVLRVKRLLAPQGDTADLKRSGALTMNLDVNVAAVHGRPLRLAPVEFAMLARLFERQGEVLSREALVDALRKGDDDVNKRTIDAHIMRLRRRLGPAASRIETVRGQGYRLR